MGELENKAKGTAKEVAGKAQQAWGEGTDQPEHEAEGRARELEGKAQKKLGEAKGKAKERADRVKKRIKRS